MPSTAPASTSVMPSPPALAIVRDHVPAFGTSSSRCSRGPCSRLSSTGASLTAVTVIVNVCGAAGVHAAVGRAAVVLQPDRDRRRPIGVRRRRVGQRPRRASIAGSAENRPLLSSLTRKVSAWPDSLAGPATDRRRPAASRSAPRRPRQHRLIGPLGEARRVVDRRDRDRERLRTARVHPAVRRAAVVLQPHRDRRRCRWRSPPACRSASRSRVDRRQHRRTDRRCRSSPGRSASGRTRRPGPSRSPWPSRPRSAPRVLQHRLVRPLGEARHVVDRRDRDRERLRTAGVRPAVGRAAVVLQTHRDRRRPIGIRRRACTSASRSWH